MLGAVVRVVRVLLLFTLAVFFFVILIIFLWATAGYDRNYSLVIDDARLAILEERRPDNDRFAFVGAYPSAFEFVSREYRILLEIDTDWLFPNIAFYAEDISGDSPIPLEVKVSGLVCEDGIHNKSSSRNLRHVLARDHRLHLRIRSGCPGELTRKEQLFFTVNLYSERQKVASYSFRYGYQRNGYRDESIGL